MMNDQYEQALGEYLEEVTFRSMTYDYGFDPLCNICGSYIDGGEIDSGTSLAKVLEAVTNHYDERHKRWP